MDWTTLFHDHIKIRKEKTEKILSELQLDGIIFGAGSTAFYFDDDQAVAFRASPHFAHWCPAEGEKHLIHFKPGSKPRLLFFQPADFWYEHKPHGSPFWASEFQVEVLGSEDEIWEALESLQDTAYIGPDVKRAEALGLRLKVETLNDRLNWERSYKSAYEVQCIEEATKISARAHMAAKEEFYRGGSELDIYLAYLRGGRLEGRQLPFEAIVALNEKGSTLHYPGKRDDVHQGLVLLLDSGATYNGIACDITRTYAADKAPPEMKALIADMETLQQTLCQAGRPGLSFADLHHQFHLGLAEILINHELVANCSVETAISEKITRAFCPHGLGHMLGVQVHDVAGQQKTPDGGKCDPDTRYPTLRSTRQLEEGFVYTIEPGLYFIDMLLKPLNEAPTTRKLLNWGRIDLLSKCGGIRIEDDIYLAPSGGRNITREYLP